MAKKFYAVKQGRKSGIYDTWSEAKEQVFGYTNAIYKSFSSLKEAKDYLKGEQELTVNNDDWIIAFTDGSFSKNDNSYSYGAVIYNKNKTIMMSQRYVDENSEYRNVAGEVYGAAKVMEYAYNNNISSLEIHHDYRGVGAWPKKGWKANNNLTQKYVKFYDKVKRKVNVRFVWVKGHSGNDGNELVDQLAKDATFDFLEVSEDNNERV